MAEDGIKFFGLPDNEEFEGEPKDNKKQKQQPASLPKEIEDMINGTTTDPNLREMMKKITLSLGEILPGAFNPQSGMAAMSDEDFEKLMEAINGEDSEDEDEDEEYDDNEYLEYTLDYIESMDDSMFGSIPCIKDSDMLEKVKNKYGEKINILDSVSGIKNIIKDKLSKGIDLTDFEKAEVVAVSEMETFILVYLKPLNDECFGIYAGIIETKPDEFALVIPGYGNSFLLDEDGEPVPLTKKDEDLITELKNGTLRFEKYNYKILTAAISYYLAPKKRVLCSPAAFGTIKNERANISQGSKFLKVGKIISNESPEAILFKKDMDLDVSQTEFDFYIKFKTEIPGVELNVFSSKFFTVNFNEIELFKNLELCSDSKGLYVQIEIEE